MKVHAKLINDAGKKFETDFEVYRMFFNLAERGGWPGNDPGMNASTEISNCVGTLKNGEPFQFSETRIKNLVHFLEKAVPNIPNNPPRDIDPYTNEVRPADERNFHGNAVEWFSFEGRKAEAERFLSYLKSSASIQAEMRVEQDPVPEPVPMHVKLEGSETVYMDEQDWRHLVALAVHSGWAVPGNDFSLFRDLLKSHADVDLARSFSNALSLALPFIPSEAVEGEYASMTTLGLLRYFVGKRDLVEKAAAIAAGGFDVVREPIEQKKAAKKKKKAKV